MGVKISDLPALESVSDSDILAVVQGGETKKIVHALRGKNGIINGGGRNGSAGFISQRGDYTSPTAMTSGIYYLDRWRASLSGITATVQDMGEAQRLTATSTATGSVGMIQFIERYSGYASTEITVSALVTSNTPNARFLVYDGTTWHSSTAHSGGGSEELLSVTLTVVASPSQLRILPFIGDSSGGNVSITSGDYIEFTDVRLDLGAHRLSGDRLDELPPCRRFWYQPESVSAYQHYGEGIASTTGACYIQIKHDTLHDVADTLSNSTISTLRLTDGVSGFTLTGLSIVASSSQRGLTVLQASASGLTIGNVYHLTNNNDATAYIGLGKEL